MIFFFLFFSFPRKRKRHPSRATSSQVAADVLADLFEDDGGSGDDFIGSGDDVIGVSKDNNLVDSEELAELEFDEHDVQKSVAANLAVSKLVQSAKYIADAKKKKAGQSKNTVTSTHVVGSAPNEVVAEAPIPIPSGGSKLKVLRHQKKF